MSLSFNEQEHGASDCRKISFVVWLGKFLYFPHQKISQLLYHWNGHGLQRTRWFRGESEVESSFLPHSLGLTGHSIFSFSWFPFLIDEEIISYGGVWINVHQLHTLIFWHYLSSVFSFSGSDLWSAGRTLGFVLEVCFGYEKADAIWLPRTSLIRWLPWSFILWHLDLL